MSTPQETQQDTPLTVTPSPLDMPGARPMTNAPVETMTAPKEMPVSKPDPKAPEGAPNTESETVEMARFRAVQELARKFEKTAKDEHTDAERYRQLVQQFSTGGEGTPPDPMAEVQRLRADWETERTERIRERVARETGVPPEVIAGADEESMKASAEQVLAWAQGLAKKSGVPAVAPAETVNSSTPAHQNGVQQIQSRDELKGMSSAQIMAAYNEGRMDRLMGKTQ
jgi:hypothetical protein